MPGQKCFFDPASFSLFSPFSAKNFHKSHKSSYAAIKHLSSFSIGVISSIFLSAFACLQAIYLLRLWAMATSPIRQGPSCRI